MAAFEQPPLALPCTARVGPPKTRCSAIHGCVPGLALVLAAGSTNAQNPLPPSAFVRVEGRHFTLGGARFRFVGANAAVMHGPAHRAAMETTLDAVAADGLRVVRVWALGEHLADAAPWTVDYAFRRGRDAWVEESFVHLDRVLAAARARELRVVVVLANRWGDYGGVPRYLELAGITVPGAAPLSPDATLARFFDEAEVRALYHAHVDRVVTRTNTVTGVAYRDDPTLMAWELINESDIAPTQRELLLRWTQETARFVRARDPAHLIAAGHIGYDRAAQRETWLALQRLPEIDYADAHAYPTRLWSARTPAQLDDFIDDHAALARHVIARPFVWGEFGFTTSARTHLGVPRARWFERFLERSEIDDVDGAMVWIYAPSSDPPREHGVIADAPRTRDVRAVLARYAARWRRETPGTNPRLDTPADTTPLWNTRRTTLQGFTTTPVRLRGGGARWTFAPEHFARLTAENLGRWDGFDVMHIYGSGDAEITYRLRVTRDSRVASAVATRVSLRFRASSELPGRGEGSTPGEVSFVRVFLDEIPIGSFVTPFDDGLGAWVQLQGTDPRVLADLRRPGVHTLRFVVPRGERAHGLCLYGHATRRRPLPPEAGELPGRVELSLQP